MAKEHKVGDKIQVNVRGKIVDAIIKAVIDTTHGVQYQVDFGSTRPRWFTSGRL
jgi:hypothetical protein